MLEVRLDSTEGRRRCRSKVVQGQIVLAADEVTRPRNAGAVRARLWTRDKDGQRPSSAPEVPLELRSGSRLRWDVRWRFDRCWRWRGRRRRLGISKARARERICDLVSE